MAQSALNQPVSPLVNYSEAIDFSVPFPAQPVTGLTVANDLQVSKRPHILSRRAARWERRTTR